VLVGSIDALLQMLFLLKTNIELMNWKGFLKPNKWKTILFLVLFIFTSWIFYGFPLEFFGNSGKCLGSYCTPVWGFTWEYFLFDMIFWYLISCLLVLICYKMKNPKNARKK
jgi:hypothetical protein